MFNITLHKFQPDPMLWRCNTTQIIMLDPRLTFTMLHSAMRQRKIIVACIRSFHLLFTYRCDCFSCPERNKWEEKILSSFLLFALYVVHTWHATDSGLAKNELCNCGVGTGKRWTNPSFIYLIKTCTPHYTDLKQRKIMVACIHPFHFLFTYRCDCFSCPERTK